MPRIVKEVEVEITEDDIVSMGMESDSPVVAEFIRTLEERSLLEPLTPFARRELADGIRTLASVLR